MLWDIYFVLCSDSLAALDAIATMRDRSHPTPITKLDLRGDPLLFMAACASFDGASDWLARQVISTLDRSHFFMILGLFCSTSIWTHVHQLNPEEIWGQLPQIINHHKINLLAETIYIYIVPSTGILIKWINCSEAASTSWMWNQNFLIFTAK